MMMAAPHVPIAMASVKQLAANYSHRIEGPEPIRSPVFQKPFMPRFEYGSPPSSPQSPLTPRSTGRTVIAKNLDSVKATVHNFNDKSETADSDPGFHDEAALEDFFSNLHQYQQQGTLVNLTVTSAGQGGDTGEGEGGEGVQCHAVVLAAASVVIRELCEARFVHTSRAPIQLQIDDVCNDVLRHVVEYVYTGHIDLSTLDKVKVKDAAEKLKIQSLVALCGQDNSESSDENSKAAHRVYLLSELMKLRPTLQPDIELKCKGGNTVPAHAAILAAANEHLRQQILEDSEKLPESLQYTDHDADTVSAFLAYFYKGKLPVQPEQADKMLLLCRELDIQFLMHELESYMSHHVEVETCASYYQTAKKLGLEEIEKAALEVILGKFYKVYVTPGFVGLTHDDLITILSDDRLTTGTQFDDYVFDAVIRWLESNDANEYDPDICKLFDCVRFDFVSHTYLKDRVVSNRYMKRYPQQTYATNAIKYQISNIRSTGCLPKSPRTGLTYDALVLISENNDMLVHKSKDPQNRWQIITKLPLWFDQESAITVVADGIVVTGGLFKKSCMLYDIRSNDSVQLAKMSVARGNHGSAYHKDLLFVGGGSGGGSFECFDMKQRVWLQMPSFPNIDDLKNPILVANEANVYVLGGTRNGERQKGLYVYDIKQGTWCQHEDLPLECDSTVGGAVLLDDQVVVIANRTEQIVPERSTPVANGRIKRPSGSESPEPRMGNDAASVLSQLKDLKVAKVVEKHMKINEQKNNLAAPPVCEQETERVHSPTCEGKIIGHLKDKKSTSVVKVNIFTLDPVTHKCHLVDEALTQFPEGACMRYQPVRFAGKAAVVVGDQLMNYDMEEHTWKPLHTLPPLDSQGGKQPEVGTVRKFLCAQFPE